MEQQSPSPQTPKEKIKPNKTALAVLAIFVLLLLGGLVYVWMQLSAAKDSKAALQKDKQQLQAQIAELKAKNKQAASPAPAPSPAVCNDTPTVAMKDNIKAALDTKNTAAFSTYTSNPVTYVLAASEKGGDVTPAQAASDLEYTHSATGPWDFNLPPATLAAYDAGFYTTYFDANTYVGKAASGMVVAFDFNCSGKIKQIFVAADAGLL